MRATGRYSRAWATCRFEFKIDSSLELCKFSPDLHVIYVASSGVTACTLYSCPFKI